MNHSSLLPDDVSPPELSEADKRLCRQLEEAMCRAFYEACDGVTQALLLHYEWRLVSNTEGLILLIANQDTAHYERILNNLRPLGNILKQFVPSARIRVLPPEQAGLPVDIRVDEISV